jgi:GNAT superfamily N-acetyltransferase
VARDDPDPGEVYAALYARLADEWLAEGVSVHDVELPVGEVDERAWFDLGFGRRTCFGVRPADMALPPREERVDIRFATDDDIEAIGRLALIEARHRAAPPQYADQGPVYADELIHLHSQLRAEGAEHLLARVRGRDVGVLTLQRTSPAPLLTGDGDPYIGPTGVDASVRGLGVGVQLVSAAVGWARDHRAASLSVAFNPPNIGARQFWRGLGFSPTGWKLARRLPIALG